MFWIADKFEGCFFTQSKKFSLDLQFNFVSTSTVAKNSGQKKTQQAVSFGEKTSQFFCLLHKRKKSQSRFLDVITERFPKNIYFYPLQTMLH